jgi:1-aminocyclopropane-1-carboxylate deaminase
VNNYFNTPSPLQRIDLSEFGITKHEVWVKRDDLIHPIVSGNKWRKLKNNIDDFLNSKNSQIVSMGGAFSNHLLSLSYICNKYNILNTLLVRGERPKELNDILLSCEEYNTKLIFTERRQYSDKNWVHKFLKENFSDYLFIPEGGANQLGINGCAQIINEIDQEFDEIYCEVGTGATFMGIASALNNHQKIIGVVVLKGAEEIAHNIANKYKEVFANKITPKAVFLHDYHMGGYAKHSAKLIEFMRLFYSKTGIKTDPIYSGKLFYALVNQLISQKDQSPKKIIALHSGGLAGIKGFENRYKLSIFSD